MIGIKKFIGWGIGIDDAEEDVLQRLNHFIIGNGLRVVDTKARRGMKSGTYWCEIELFYEYRDEYEEE